MDITHPMLRMILEDARSYCMEEGSENVSLVVLCQRMKMSMLEMADYIADDQELVIRMLEYERFRFNEIFDNYDFEGVNAIEILLLVSREVNERFLDVSPAITMALKQQNQKVYEGHLQSRLDFIFEKMKINIEKGVNQGMYRSDFSVELVARLYISRLIDLHKPKYFPPEKFSFELVFDTMFENFIRGIATAEGLAFLQEHRSEYRA